MINEPVATGRNINANNKQKRELSKLKKKEHWMKWALWAAAILILLLLLLLGYATDWTRGLRKDPAGSTPTDASLDALKDGSATAATTGSNGGNGGNGGGGDGQDTSNTTNERSSTSTTTTTNTSTTNNTTTPGDEDTTVGDALLGIYSDTQLGDNMNDALQRAQDSGVTTQCDNDPLNLVQTCTFVEDGRTVTMRSLLGNTNISSIVKDF